MHPSLNYLILNRALNEQTIVEITHWSFKSIRKSYDKAAIPYAVIEAIRAMPKDYKPLEQSIADDLPWLYILKLQVKLHDDRKMKPEAKEEALTEAIEDQSVHPFVGGRGSYQHILFDEIGIGKAWEEKRDIRMHADNIEQLFENPAQEQLTRLSDLVTDFATETSLRKAKLEAERAASGNILDISVQRFSITASHRFLVARILGKSRVMYHGSRDKVEKWPCRFTLRIVDLSGVEVNVTFWGSPVPALYNAVQVGQIIKLAGLKLRDIYKGDSPVLSSLLTGRAFTPPFEINFNPTRKDRKELVILSGELAHWFDTKIATLPLPFSIYTLRERMFSADHDAKSVVKSLQDSYHAKTADAPLDSIVGLVSWIGALELRNVRGVRIYSRWVYVVDLVESEEFHSRGAFLQLRMGPSIEVPRALSASHVRFELHLGQMVGISTIFSDIHAWEDSSVDFDENAQKELPELAAKYQDLCSGWPFTLRFEQPKDYAKLFGAKLIPNFLKIMPPTRPDSEDEAMLVEETPVPSEMMLTQEPVDSRSGRKSDRNGTATTSSSREPSTTNSTKESNKKKKSTAEAQDDSSDTPKMAAESSMKWIEKLTPTMRVDRIVACDKFFASTFLFAGDYDASKICGVLTQKEVDAVVESGHHLAEKRRRGHKSEPPRTAELFWAAFSAFPLSETPSPLPVEDPPSMSPTESQAPHDADEELTPSQLRRQTRRKRQASDPSTISESRSKLRAGVQRPTLFFCAVVPVSPVHLCQGNAYTFNRLQEDHKNLTETIARLFRLSSSLAKKYSYLIGFSIYKPSAEEAVRFTIGNIWREPRNPGPEDTDIRQGLEQFTEYPGSLELVEQHRAVVSPF